MKHRLYSVFYNVPQQKAYKVLCPTISDAKFDHSNKMPFSPLQLACNMWGEF